MPNHHDFSKLENVRETKIYPEGWVQPVIIEYGVAYHGEVLSYHWRVKGTEHTFVIPVMRMDFLTGGRYEDHFKDVLEGFREDYKEWKEQNFFTEWMQGYEREFSGFIDI